MAEKIFMTGLTLRTNEMVTPYMNMWWEGNILRCTFADKLELTLEKASFCVQKRIAFSEGIDRLCLIDMRGLKSVTKDAREYLADEGSKCITAGALLIGSALTRTIGNIFLSLNKPPVPTKLFTDVQEAKEWLMRFT